MIEIVLNVYIRTQFTWKSQVNQAIQVKYGKLKQRTKVFTPAKVLALVCLIEQYFRWAFSKLLKYRKINTANKPAQCVCFLSLFSARSPQPTSCRMNACLKQQSHLTSGVFGGKSNGKKRGHVPAKLSIANVMYSRLFGAHWKNVTKHTFGWH